MSRSRISALLAALGIALASSASASVSGAERAALVAIFQSTGGAAWTERANWLGAAGTECGWFGVRCDASQNSVVGLLLVDNGLQGTLPKEIGALSNLAELDLGFNDLGGVVPAELAQLTKLTKLDLSDNHFTGGLPSPVFALASLTSLRLGGNRFSQAISPMIGQLVNLVTLDLSNNQLSGEAPPAFQSLTKLADGGLDLRYNAIAVPLSLRPFLDRKQAGGDVLGTQTLPPRNVKVSESDDPFKAAGDVVVSWNPPDYISDPGGYQVTVLDPGGADLVTVQTTASKEYTDIVLTGNRPASRSYVVRTVTHPHGRQQNTLTSDPSAPALLQVFPMASPYPRPVVGAPPETMVQTSVAAATPVTFEILNLGDAPAAMSIASVGAFFDARPSATVLGPGASETITIVPTAEPAGTYEGKVFVSGDGMSGSVALPVKLVSTAPLAGTVVAGPATPRIDLSAKRGTNPGGRVSFTNRGTTTLHGVARSDVEWIVPQQGAVTIEPGGTRSVGFTIDRAKRPDAASKNGTAFSGALTLDFVEPEPPPAGARFDAEDSGGAGVSTTLVSVIDTVTPPLTNGMAPALAPGEVALFVPGLEHRRRIVGDLLSDLSIANAFGSASIGDVRLYFSPSGGASSGSVASLGAVAPRGAVQLADVVSTVYGQTERGGSLQIRSLQAGRLLAGARLVAAVSGRGMIGTMLPVFRSSRSVRPGGELRLAGIGNGASEADLVVQETSGAPAGVRVEYLDAGGRSLGVTDPVRIEPFGSVEFRGEVPDGAAAALVSNRSDSTGRIVAYGRNLDATIGDVWAVNDWSVLSGFDPSSAQKIIYVPPRVAEVTRHRPVRPGSAPARAGEIGVTLTTLELIVHNAGLEPASASLSYFANGTGVGPKTVSLAPRETRSLDDVVPTLFGVQGDAAGWIAIEPRRGAPIAVSARVVTGGAAPSTATVPVASLSSGLRLGQTQLFAGIDDARQAAIDEHLGGTTSTTLGIAETGGKRTTVRASMVYFDGSLLAARVTSREFVVGANSVLLVPNITRAIAGDARERELGDLRDIQLEIRVTAGDGAITPFVVATDNGSGDAIVRLE
jgi:hypothetical protein